MFSGPLPNQLLPNVSTVPLAEPGAPVFSASPKAVSEKRWALRLGEKPKTRQRPHQSVQGRRVNRHRA